tara:strand:- start:50 stop:514 length:465 start_codon:yes stop_codon:yes gene_type:complete
MRGTIARPKIQGSVEYGWSHIQVLINNVPLSGIVGLDYEETTDTQNVYGASNLPIARSFTNHEFTGTLTLLNSEISALQDAARLQGIGSGDYTSLLPFTIIVSYIPTTGGEGLPRVDILEEVQFNSNSRGMSQNDPTIETSIDLIIGSIQWGEI